GKELQGFLLSSVSMVTRPPCSLPFTKKSRFLQPRTWSDGAAAPVFGPKRSFSTSPYRTIRLPIVTVGLPLISGGTASLAVYPRPAPSL
ncbi:hypothetical protein GOODEAATRI_016736, partial [Goodea atripinnis]